MENMCPYCGCEKTDEVVIKLATQQEQKVRLCNQCKKIFKKEEE